MKCAFWFALPVAVAGAALLCLAGGASAGRKAAETQNLSVTVSGPGTITGPGINCRESGGDCVEGYADGTVVTLTATPDSGATFSTGWYGDCSGTATTCTLTMNSVKGVGAAFTPGGGGTSTLTVSVTGNGTVTGTGINCGNGATDCTESYTTGTSVTLTESTPSGATFTGWGGSCSGTGTTCNVTMSASKTVTATFSGGAAMATLTVSVSGNGKVIGPGINCGSGATTCSASYSQNASVTLTQVANAGATFAGWGGSCSGTGTNCTVQMTTSKTVTAIFSGATTQAALSVTVTGSGRVFGPGINCGLGNTDCSEIYTTGSSITLAETPASGASFIGWGNACSGATSSCTIVMDANKSLTASFSQGSTQKILTVTVGGSGRVSGPGISCGTTIHDCSNAYNDGAVVTLLATPAAGAVFLGWGGSCSGTGNTCTLVLDAPKAVSASFSTPGGNNNGGGGGAGFVARSLGNPLVVRNSVGWGVTLRFFANRSAAALLRLTLNGRLVNAFTFSPHSGAVLVGPFNVSRAGLYRFRLTLNDSRGQSHELFWDVCLSSSGCGAFTPAGRFVRSLGVTATRTATGFLVRVRFHAGGAGVATLTMSRGGRLVSRGTFTFHSGTVAVDLPARVSGFHQIVLNARNAAGRTFQLRWNVLIS
jgi:hypothetical protein